MLSLKFDKKMYFLLYLVIIDYILTFIGVKIGFYDEVNPLMKWLFEYSFALGLTIKGLYSTILLLPICVFKEINYSLYRKGMNILIGLYLSVCLYHTCLYIILFGGALLCNL